MAKRRMIESDIWRDDFIYGLSILGRLLWIGLMVTCADDQGRLRCHPRLIRSDIFPLDEVSAEEIEALLQEFARAGRVVIYQAGGKDLLQIVGWWQYQTPAWAVPSNYPPPPGWTDREKYHAPGNQVLSRNWDLQGGFQPGWVNPAGQDSAPRDSTLQGSELPDNAPQDSALQGSAPQDSVPDEDSPAVLPGACPDGLSTGSGSPLPSSLHSALYSVEGRALNDDDVKDKKSVRGMKNVQSARFFLFDLINMVKESADLLAEVSKSLAADADLPAAAWRIQASRAPPGCLKSRARPGPTAILAGLPGATKTAGATGSERVRGGRGK